MIKPTAKMAPSTSSVKLTIPVTVAESTQYIEFGINLMTIPKKLTEAEDADLESIAKAFDEAMTETISVSGPGEDVKILDMPVAYAMAHVISTKLKGKINVG